ncbi:hypothetical protein ACFL35_04440, partial [Candidatus Riflebacteria bacterium]
MRIRNRFFFFSFLISFLHQATILAATDLSAPALDFVDKIYALQLEKNNLLRKMKQFASDFRTASEKKQAFSGLPLDTVEALFNSRKNDELLYFTNIKKGIQDLSDLYEIYERRRKQYKKSHRILQSYWNDLQRRNIRAVVDSFSKFIEEYEIHLTLFISKLENLVKDEPGLKDRFYSMSIGTRFSKNLQQVKKNLSRYNGILEKGLKNLSRIAISFPPVELPKFEDGRQSRMLLSKITRLSYSDNLQIKNSKKESFKVLLHLDASLKKMQIHIFNKADLFYTFYKFFVPFFKEAMIEVEKIRDLLNFAISIPRLSAKGVYSNLLEKVDNFNVNLKKNHTEMESRIFKLDFFLFNIFHSMYREFITYLDTQLDLIEILTRIQNRNIQNLGTVKKVVLYLPIYVLSGFNGLHIELINFLSSDGLSSSQKYKALYEKLLEYKNSSDLIQDSNIKIFARFRQQEFNLESVKNYFLQVLTTFEGYETKILTAKNNYQQILLKTKNDEVSGDLELANEIYLKYLKLFLQVEKMIAIYAVFIDRVKNKRIMANFISYFNQITAQVKRYGGELEKKIKEDSLLATENIDELTKQVRIYNLKLKSAAEKAFQGFNNTKEILIRMIRREMNLARGIHNQRYPAKKNLSSKRGKTI